MSGAAGSVADARELLRRLEPLIGQLEDAGQLDDAAAMRVAREHRLFNPRSDQWDTHFAWSSDYLRILPLNVVGDATIRRLNMNDPNASTPARVPQTRSRRESLAVSAQIGLSMTALRAVWTHAK